jgi:CubicO group peptidase (beta-lactamase class C family)
MSNSSNDTVDENTVFAIGSNTKVFTTNLLADMVIKGLINLDDPIEK